MRTATQDARRDSVTFGRIRELLEWSSGVVSMEDDGEAPTLLRVELTTVEEAEAFALKFHLHPHLAGFNAEQCGSVVVVSERE